MSKALVFPCSFPYLSLLLSSFISNFVTGCKYFGMITQNQLDALASKLSTLPCPACGGVHSVSLKLYQASSILGPVSPTVLYGFPDEDTCEAFKQKATAFIQRFIAGMAVEPFPFDRI